MKTGLLNGGSMSKTFKLELTIVLTDEQQRKLIEAARRVYASGPPSVQYKGGSSCKLSPEEFIDGPEGALTYVIEQNTLLDELDIRGDAVSCAEVDSEESDDPDELEYDPEEA